MKSNKKIDVMSDGLKIKHLYARAGFGLNLEEAKSKNKSSLQKEVRQLLKVSSYDEIKIPQQVLNLQKKAISMQETMGRRQGRKLEDEVKKYNKNIVMDWIGKMTEGKNPLLEKMTLFWHGHFACRIKMPHLAANQINTIRKNSLGNFKTLVKDIAQDPAMILYLNNQQNNKKKPNENFARELMELFTIGIGNYSEKDIKEAGRAFTGWKADVVQGEFKFVERQHDYGTKTFMGKKGAFNGDDIIDIILEQKEVSIFIARKIYKYFVNPKVDENKVKEIAGVFYNSDYDIKKMMQFIFSSDWFYGGKNRGVKIKSPVELFVGLKKILDVDLPQQNIMKIVGKGLGQALFNPPNVAGWPGDKSWIDNATLMLRLNLPHLLLLAKDVEVKGMESFSRKPKNKSADLRPFIQEFSKKENSEIADDLIHHFIHPPLAMNKGLLYKRIELSTPEEVIQKIIFRTLSLPEFQMC